MKQFNLEKALAGDPVVMRNGTPARQRYKVENGNQFGYYSFDHFDIAP
jgi:hypothetical protein